MSSIVLDSSALIALINQEEGADRVAFHMSNAIMSCVNVSEAAALLEHKGISAKEIKTLMNDLLAEQVLFDREQSYLAASLRSATKTRGLSLGDRACLSLAKIKNLSVITADRAWSGLDIDLDIIIIR